MLTISQVLTLCLVFFGLGVSATLWLGWRRLRVRIHYDETIETPDIDWEEL